MNPDASSPTDALNACSADWEVFAQEDPLWAILTDPARRGGRWDEAEFFATGEGDANAAFALVQDLEPFVRRRLALDFGCGVGRVTRGLRRHFRRVVGVDAAPSMIERARVLNAEREGIEFLCSSEPVLPFADGIFDFVHSCLVLQHLPVPAALDYVGEFMRVLEPGGAACFSIPSAFGPTAGEAEAFVTRFDYGARSALMRMNRIAPDEVWARVQAAGGRRVDSFETAAGDGVVQTTYVVRRLALG